MIEYSEPPGEEIKIRAQELLEDDLPYYYRKELVERIEKLVDEIERKSED